MARKPKVKDRHRRVASALRKGATDREALLEAGYSEASAKKGITNMQREVPALAEAINDESMKQARELIAQQGRKLNKEELEQLVEAVLIRNSVNGEGDRKGSSYAAKLLGSLSRVNLFEPDMSVNPLFLSVPPEWKDRYSLPEAEAKEQPVDLVPQKEQKHLHGIPVYTTEDAAPPALPPAPEPTGEPQQET